MQNYTRIDLKMDYKRDTGDSESDINGCSLNYLQYLEENLIKYRNEERQIADMNSKIADAIYEENHQCDCGECNCHMEDEQ